MFARKLVVLMVTVILPVFATDKSIYDFTVNDINGLPIKLEHYRGKALLMVNTACQCGYTDSNFLDLPRLQQILGGNSFEILAFPCNDFGGQEPWEPDQIQKFLQSNYQLPFPLMQKVNILGENPHPLWKHIIDVSGITPTWNFHKYLFDSNGEFIQAWDVTVPLSDIYDDVKAVVGSSSTGSRAEL